MSYSIEKINEIIAGRFLQKNNNDELYHLFFDSRKIISPVNSLFFAFKAARRNGHEFIEELYKRGARNFIVTEKVIVSKFPQANFVLVADALKALQELAAFHRKRFNLPVIGITGSNGKTIVKEWLFQLLHEDLLIVRSPKSFNSQIGVPVSVWQINEDHQLGIFEAGISQPGEMQSLEKIIQPTIGILTNIGAAHSEGFKNEKEKLREKLQLFRNCQTVISRKDILNELEKEEMKSIFQKCSVLFTWSMNDLIADLLIKNIRKEKDQTIITFNYQQEERLISIPFLDEASVENAINCLSVLIVLKKDWDLIEQRMKNLHSVNMRMELKKGINHCSIINDSYSADLSSLNIALNFLQQQGRGKKTLIISDLLQSGMGEDELYNHIALLINVHEVNRVIGIGPKISKQLAVKIEKKEIQQEYYLRTASFLDQFRFSMFKDEAILIKGARQFGFEEIVRMLEQKVHQTVLEINLNAITNNLKTFQKLIKPSTKVMAMVKAFAYGSGGAEIAAVLQFHNVDYLAVAYADEGVELRKSGILLPIMVMNPEESTFDVLTEYNLEPEIYSFNLLKKFFSHLENEGLQQYPIHLEFETGMNRLGFSVNEIEDLVLLIKESALVKVQSVFSHLVASEEPSSDDFSLIQYKLFKEAAQQLQSGLGYPVIKHISNSAAIVRHPQLELDMVRLGIGLYGINSSGSDKLKLEPAATLRSTIAQVKKIKKGETVSYNRKGVVERDSTIATIRIGYADGIPRRLGNGLGKILVKGKLAPIIGTICMDMLMIDVTNIPDVQEGDDVIIFGKELSISQLADWAGTLPYEIMTGISQRVKRVYFEE